MRYLVDFDTRKLDIQETDVLVIGSGIAGLSAAFECAPYYDTMVLSKSSVSNTATWYAQGGIASAVGSDDSIDFHYQDTLKAGAGLCDKKVVKTFIDDSLSAIDFLKDLGSDFDQEKNTLLLALEGGHSKPRIVHKKDYTGSEIQQKLVKATLRRKGIKLVENAFTIDLLTDKNTCFGVIVKQNQKKWAVFAKAIILATGGVGQLYRVTTNPDISTGDGIAMALRAGAYVADMEFIQFHPTTLHTKKKPRFLITEALRGEGAYLRDQKGKRFLKEISKDGELASRDIVARAIYEKIENQQKNYVCLDSTHIDRNILINNYPSVYQACLDAGLDLTNEPVPVSPAAHYLVGGVKADVNGQTNIKNFYVSGESAATGFHGANRLASNSLLEGVVLSRRIASKLKQIKITSNKKDIVSKRNAVKPLKSQAKIRERIQKQMSKNVSMLRDSRSLLEARGVFEEIYNDIVEKKVSSQKQFELINLAQLAQVVTKNALWRKESRGVHLRRDFPEKSDRYQKHKVFSYV